jgi:hypothetical protein
MPSPQERFDSLYQAIKPLVTAADPSALGGAEDEYENQVNQICEYALYKKPISAEILTQMFEMPNSEELSVLADKINTEVVKVDAYEEGSDKKIDAIKRILQINDPAGLIAGGAPPDEYEAEALEISSQIKRKLLNGNNAVELIEKIFFDNFGNDTDWDKEKIRVIAEAVPKLSNTLHICPVCGYTLDFEPWDEESPSDEICPSCGTQFGYTDAIRFRGSDTEIKARYYELRQKWIDAGMIWDKGRSTPPPNWDPEKQLKNIEWASV